MPPYESRQHLPDSDPEETDEWMEALRSVVASQGVERARLLLHEPVSYTHLTLPTTPYV